MSAPPVVVAWVPDLMDRSRLAAAVPDLRTVMGADALVAAVAEATAGPEVATAGRVVAVVDLARAGALDAIAAVRAADAGHAVAVVAFGSHVEREVLAAARTAGADRVLARSALFAGLPDTVVVPAAG